MAICEEMKNVKALVTGAGTGIGRAIATEFADHGAEVALHYSHSAEGAESAVEDIKAQGGRARAFRADFRKTPEVVNLGHMATEFLGGIDVLVNNAGITMDLPFGQVTPEQFDTLYSVNIKGQFFLTQTVVPKMQKQGKGVIINITSVHAFGGIKEHSVYAGTKGAILSYTRELAVELSEKNIRVNTIAPGWIRTENQENVVFSDDFDWDEAGRHLPAGHIARSKEIAHMAAFLASDKANYIYGQTFVVDGGQMAVMPCIDFHQGLEDCNFGKGYVEGR